MQTRSMRYIYAKKRENICLRQLSALWIRAFVRPSIANRTINFIGSENKIINREHTKPKPTLKLPDLWIPVGYRVFNENAKEDGRLRLYTLRKEKERLGRQNDHVHLHPFSHSFDRSVNQLSLSPASRQSVHSPRQTWHDMT